MNRKMLGRSMDKDRISDLECFRWLGVDGEHPVCYGGCIVATRPT